MRSILSLGQEQTNDVLIWANQIMQQLDEKKEPVLQIFEYIRRFAQLVRSRGGENFHAQLSAFSPAPGLMLYTIEPPCGSNTHILRYKDELLFVDTGFACYREEMLALFRSHIPGFDSMRRRAVLTHADVDHAGLLDLFDAVWMSEDCCRNFALERENKPNFREQYPMHSPYARLSRVIPGYVPPPEEVCASVGDRSGDELFVRKLSVG